MQTHDHLGGLSEAQQYYKLVALDEKNAIEVEINHLAILSSQKSELKNQWEQWLDATARGMKDVEDGREVGE